MRKIVFFDVYSDEKSYFRSSFRNVFKSQVICTEEPLTEITAKKYADTEIVSVFVTSDVNLRAIERLPKLELISTRSTGYDHIDLSAAKKHHVLVSNVPTYGEVTVAEFAVMLMLALSRRLPENAEQARSGAIDHPDITGFDLAGKTLGLIGCGRIGRHVARIATGLDMKVIGYDPFPSEDDNIKYAELKTLLKDSDIISLHAPATKENHHLINAKTIAKMKPGAILVNTARGELVDLRALVEALYSGQLGAAGLDVLEGEHLLKFEEEVSLLHPGASSHDLLLNAQHKALLRMSNVIITPHNAFNSREALLRIRHATAENIRKYLMHEPQNVVKK